MTNRRLSLELSDCRENLIMGWGRGGKKFGGYGGGGYCSRGAQRVLRYGDIEYVMLHLIFIYLMPGEGQPAAYAASDL